MKTINERMTSTELDEWLAANRKWELARMDAVTDDGFAKGTPECVCGHVAVARWPSDAYHMYDAGTGKAPCRTGKNTPECPCKDFVQKKV